MHKNQKGFSAVEGLLILVIVGLVGFTGWYVWNSNKKSNASLVNANKVNSSQTVPKTASTKGGEFQPNGKGTIEGNASYPAEGLPADEKVCAEKKTNASVTYCDNVGSRQKQSTCGIGDPSCTQTAPDLSFKIEVPAGDYYVYATAQKELPGVKAYWNEFAKCGNKVSCPASGHKAYITVTVAEGAFASADPSDWYTN